MQPSGHERELHTIRLSLEQRFDKHSSLGCLDNSWTQAAKYKFGSLPLIFLACQNHGVTRVSCNLSSFELANHCLCVTVLLKIITINGLNLVQVSISQIKFFNTNA